MDREECILNKGEPCTDCKECLYCDLDPNKKCDNCMECIEEETDFRGVKIDEVLYE